MPAITIALAERLLSDPIKTPLLFRMNHSSCMIVSRSMGVSSMENSAANNCLVKICSVGSLNYRLRYGYFWSVGIITVVS
jgi:hypothetical protein